MPVERHGVESGFGQGLAEARFQRPVSGLEIVLCAITGGDPGEACERIGHAERFSGVHHRGQAQSIVRRQFARRA